MRYWNAHYELKRGRGKIESLGPRDTIEDILWFVLEKLTFESENVLLYEVDRTKKQLFVRFRI